MFATVVDLRSSHVPWPVATTPGPMWPAALVLPCVSSAPGGHRASCFLARGSSPALFCNEAVGSGPECSEGRQPWGGGATWAVCCCGTLQCAVLGRGCQVTEKHVWRGSTSESTANHAAGPPHLHHHHDWALLVSGSPAHEPRPSRCRPPRAHASLAQFRGWPPTSLRVKGSSLCSVHTLGHLRLLLSCVAFPRLRRARPVPHPGLCSGLWGAADVGPGHLSPTGGAG